MNRKESVMKKLLLAIAIVSSIFLVPSKEVVKPAECSWCYTGACYSDAICGSTCHCLRRQPWEAGLCYAK